MDFAVVLGWWRTADILKIEKSRYLGNDMTDRRQIWQSDAFDHLHPCIL